MRRQLSLALSLMCHMFSPALAQPAADTPAAPPAATGDAEEQPRSDGAASPPGSPEGTKATPQPDAETADGANATDEANTPGGADATDGPTPTAAPAAVACGIAAPACFRDCATDSVRTKSGLCIPAQPPQPGAFPDASRRLTVSVLNAEDFPAEPAAAQPQRTETEHADPEHAAVETAPETSATSLPCCLLPLRVGAIGVINLGNRAETETLELDVRINGRIVGQTEFRDELPVGDYMVAIERPGAPPHIAHVRLRPGQGASVQTKYHLEPDGQQRERRDAWRKQRAERVRAERSAAAARDRARIEARYQADLERWEQSTADDRARRKLHHLGALGSAIGGAALTVVGAVLVINAAATDDAIGRTRAEWQQAVIAEQRDRLAAEIEDLRRTHNRQMALGTTGLVLGGVGLIGGLLLYLTAPKIPDEPQVPPGLELAFTGGPGSGGAQLSLHF